MKFYLSTILAVAALSSGSVVKPSDGTFELLILHNNDMHARFEQTSQQSGVCTTADRDAGKCYGGFPRVAHVVKEARRAAQTGEGPPVLYLNAGDTYTGTAWFTIYKWKIAAEFINALQPDAVSFGNNEVDENSILSPFLENINTTILATNVFIKSAKGIAPQKSIIFKIDDIQIGVVGYLTPENSILDSFGNVEYIDEVIALTEEVEKLQAQDVNIIIALGHSSIDKDKEIAREVAGIDLIIAGNKNTFYWNGDTVQNQPESIVVTQEAGRKVPIIFSTTYNKYLGSVDIKFNADGEIVEYNNQPILLDLSIPQDATSLDIINQSYSELPLKSNEVLGYTAVVLDAETCSLEECNFGNFVTDAIMYYYATRYQGDTWTDAPIVIIHSGAFGESIAPTNRPATVTRGDVMSAIPLESNLVTVTMNGNTLKQVLEHSISDYNQREPTGQFLQYSGIRVEYDLGNEPGSRVVNAVVRCWSCFVPEYYIIDDWRDYKVLMPAALANGEFGYDMLVGLPKNELLYDEVTCTSEYVELRTPVYPEVAGRIILRNVPDAPSSATAISTSLSILILIAITVCMYK